MWHEVTYGFLIFTCRTLMDRMVRGTVPLEPGGDSFQIIIYYLGLQGKESWMARGERRHNRISSWRWKIHLHGLVRWKSRTSMRCWFFLYGRYGKHHSWQGEYQTQIGVIENWDIPPIFNHANLIRKLVKNLDSKFQKYVVTTGYEDDCIKFDYKCADNPSKTLKTQRIKCGGGCDKISIDDEANGISMSCIFAKC